VLISYPVVIATSCNGFSPTGLCIIVFFQAGDIPDLGGTFQGFFQPCFTMHGLFFRPLLPRGEHLSLTFPFFAVKMYAAVSRRVLVRPFDENDFPPFDFLRFSVNGCFASSGRRMML